MHLAIRAQRLSKRYRLGARVGAYGTLRDAFTSALAAPARRLGAGRGSSAGTTIDALDDVSFEIGEGEIVGIVGRNGSGKSTLLKILSRITQPTSGFAEVRGRVGSLLEVGTGFHPELTGRENVYVNGAILGMKRAEIQRKFDEIVAFADVGAFIDTAVKRYSSGMQMRLAFSVAAHLEPHILLIDEVLAVGDAGFQRKCLGKMDEVRHHGRTILFVSHQMTQIRRLCTRGIWLDGGRLRSSGPAADVTNRYEASFMETPVAGTGVHSPGAVFLDWTLGADGAKTCALSTFGPVVVRFTLRVDRPIRRGHHGLALYDRDNLVVWGASADQLDLDIGQYEIAYAIDSLPLRPGPYRWHVSLFDDGRFITNLDCVPEMSVETPPLGHRRDEYAGFLNLPHTLEFRRLDAAPANARRSAPDEVVSNA